MAKSFRPLRDQPMLLPVDMREWLAEDHLVWFVLDTVDVLDVSDLERSRRRGGSGAAGYDPRKLLGLLMFAYCHGVRSSRQVERLCHTDVAFRVLCAQDVPDHATIARFRAQHQKSSASLFTQVLMIAGRAGLTRFGTVAIDGTKIAANASIDANRGRAWFAEQAGSMIVDAKHADAIEDARADRHGDLGGDRVPPGLVDRSRRAERIREAARQLAERHDRLDEADPERDAAARGRLARSEAGLPVVGCIPKGPHHLAEARAHLARELRDHQAKLDRRAAIIASGRKPMGAPPVPTEQHSRILRARRVVAAAEQAAEAERAAAAGRPVGPELPKTVANITDPHSRVMPTRRGFIQGYNAQVAVTADRLIAAVRVGQSPNDMSSFIPMMHAAVDAATTLHETTELSEHQIGVVLTALIEIPHRRSLKFPTRVAPPTWAGPLRGWQSLTTHQLFEGDPSAHAHMGRGRGSPRTTSSGMVDLGDRPAHRPRPEDDPGVFERRAPTGAAAPGRGPVDRSG